MPQSQPGWLQPKGRGGSPSVLIYCFRYHIYHFAVPRLRDEKWNPARNEQAPTMRTHRNALAFGHSTTLQRSEKWVQASAVEQAACSFSHHVGGRTGRNMAPLRAQSSRARTVFRRKYWPFASLALAFGRSTQPSSQKTLPISRQTQQTFYSTSTAPQHNLYQPRWSPASGGRNVASCERSRAGARSFSARKILAFGRPKPLATQDRSHNTTNPLHTSTAPQHNLYQPQQCHPTSPRQLVEFAKKLNKPQHFPTAQSRPIRATPSQITHP